MMVEIRMQKTQKTPNVSETAEFTWLKVPPLEIHPEKHRPKKPPPSTTADVCGKL